MDKKDIMKVLSVVLLIANTGLTLASDKIEQERQNEKIAKEVDRKLDEKLKDLGI